MKRLYKAIGTAWLLGLASVALVAGAAGPPQAAAPLATPVTTQERLSTEDWWPTKSNVTLGAFVGSAACASCHQADFPGEITSMQRASARADGSSYSGESSASGFASQGRIYSLSRGPDHLRYTVSEGPQRLSETLDWVMGAGDLGRTFLYVKEGRWYQSLVSFYTKASALDVTTGLHSEAGSSLPGALGQALSPEDARTCFGCHTVHATTSAGFNPLHAEAGLGCEACHGPGRAHAQRMSRANTAAVVKTAATQGEDMAIFNPAKLSPSDSIDLCGSCHRTFADASLSIGPGADLAAVRFQPYRLEESACWRKTQDERLTCVACHDPHRPLSRDAVSYDKHCLQCHTAARSIAATGTPDVRVCPKATSQCVTCHMPKVALPSMHGTFTDHFIRVARVGDPLPR